MTKVLVDETLRSKLHNFSEPVDLCDESGQILAHVTPMVDLSQYEPCEPEITEEELLRREKSDKWYSTQQVLAHLKSLEKQ